MYEEFFDPKRPLESAPTDNGPSQGPETAGREEPAAKMKVNNFDRRSAPRFEVSAKVGLTIFAELGNGTNYSSDASRMRIVREGFSNDLSLTGLCMVMDGTLTGITGKQLEGKKAKIRLDLNRPDAPELNLLGRIAWIRELEGTTRFGIQFTDLRPEDRTILERFCQQDEGELNRISNLWELLVANPKQHRRPGS